jgi:hypothetical protein
VARVNAIQEDFARAVRPLSATITPNATAARDEATLRRFGAAVRALIARLSAISPPPAVASLHARLRAELDRYARALARAVRRIAAGTPGGFGVVAQGLMGATRAGAARIDATIVAMNRALHG